jgi:PleD family two-component response regulator
LRLAILPARDGFYVLLVSCRVAIDSADLQQVLKKADQAMYLAKNSGRNGVIAGK